MLRGKRDSGTRRKMRKECPKNKIEKALLWLWYGFTQSKSRVVIILTRIMIIIILKRNVQKKQDGGHDRSGNHRDHSQEEQLISIILYVKPGLIRERLVCNKPCIFS